MPSMRGKDKNKGGFQIPYPTPYPSSSGPISPTTSSSERGPHQGSFKDSDQQKVSRHKGRVGGKD